MTKATPATAAKSVKPVKPPKVKVTMGPREIRAAKAFSNAKKAEAAAKERKTRAEKILRDALGDAEIGTAEIGGITLNIVEVMHSKNTNYSKEILIQLDPEIEAAAKIVTPYTYLKTV